MKPKRIATAVFFLTVITIGNSAGAYDYGNGIQAPHPNSKYWRVTGQPPQVSIDGSAPHLISLLHEENTLLNEEAQLLRKQIKVLTEQGKCVKDASKRHLSVELQTLDQSLSTLDQLLYRVRRTRRTFGK